MHRLIEIKSESAIRNVTGANEIVGQFNKYRRYFFESSVEIVPFRDSDTDVIIRFELCFVPTERNIIHFYENIVLYREVFKKKPYDPSGLRQENNYSPAVYTAVTAQPTFQKPSSPELTLILLDPDESLESLVDKYAIDADNDNSIL